MVKFTGKFQVNEDGSYEWGARSPDDAPIHPLDVLSFFNRAQGDLLAKMTAPPPVALPDGWAATEDGVSVNMVIGGNTTYSRTYLCDGGTEHPSIIKTAPCNADGSPNAETIAVLNGA